MKKIGQMSSWTTEAQCVGGFFRGEIPCGDTFQVTEEDLKAETRIVMGETSIKVIGFVCPTCGSFTEVHRDKIPEVIRNRVLAKNRIERNAERKQGFKDRLKRFLFN